MLCRIVFLCCSLSYPRLTFHINRLVIAQGLLHAVLFARQQRTTNQLNDNRHHKNANSFPSFRVRARERWGICSEFVSNESEQRDAVCVQVFTIRIASWLNTGNRFTYATLKSYQIKHCAFVDLFLFHQLDSMIWCTILKPCKLQTSALQSTVVWGISRQIKRP